MFSYQFKSFLILLILPLIDSFRIVIRDQLAPPHNKRADNKITQLTKICEKCQILKLSSFQKSTSSRKTPSYWTYTTVLTELAKDAQWTLFIEPQTILTEESFIQIQKLTETDNQTPTIFTNKLIDKDLSIIHHFAGYKPEESYKKSFIDFSRGFLANKVMLQKLSNYRPQNNPQSFHIDAAHELSEFIDKALNQKRDWLQHSDIFKSIQVQKFSDHNCGTKIKDDDFMIAVKTAQHLHKSRLKIVSETWGLEFKNIKFFSNVTASLFGGIIETTDTYKVPNTERGHCGKTSAIIKNFDDQKFKFLVIVDDDTIFGKNELLQILNCYNPSDELFIGERYGFALNNKYSGYNYITGGGGMILTSSAVKIYKQNCNCPSLESPDDMVISDCLERNGVSIVHEPSFHQARPEDYTEGYLKAHGAVSFHKHWNCDPKKIYQTWFSDSKHDEL